MDGLFEDAAGGCGRIGQGECGAAVCEEFGAVAGAVDAAGVGEFADCDGPVRIDAALVDPGLDSVQVYGLEVWCEPIRIISITNSSILTGGQVLGLRLVEAYAFLNPRFPRTISNGVCPPLNPAGTFPLAFCPL